LTKKSSKIEKITTLNEGILMFDVNAKNIKLHECEEFKKNKLILDELNNHEEAEISLLYDGCEWSIGLPYWNDNYSQVDNVYSRVKYCPYCRAKYISEV
jgi:hypothetical protein